ncbi:helicase-related protein [Ferrimonas balearica]|uniref:helicase-related protein n=1 Tax=Ferrimonas balearica TaxID=44012 RepID=UPI001C999A9E|nr:helicase-related protein [Ferrimonas balearica]MBY5923149.1 ATP-dependent RNA helicase [Ferrimonas balearica]MBY5997475.1 ATP-dependent RNA helicase [Ferrimonas balearica]
MSTPIHTLPIDPLKPRFVEALSRHHLVVEADTGSGKSTRLPLWAAEQGRVLVVEPRRVACTALAEFLALESGQPLGEQVGYAIRFDSNVTDKTRVAFVTPGIALRWLSEDGLAGFQTVIIDEFHERRWDTDLLLALLKARQQHRLVLTSATVDGARLAGYLEGERLLAQGRRFDVTIRHRARDGQSLPDDRNLTQRVQETVLEQITEREGDILVFLPGRKEITQCESSLKSALGESALVLPLHASVPRPIQRQALTQGPRRRVILATNVAETSLTIPGVTLVIDSGLERRTRQRNGRTVLALTRISQASAAQRAGRAGRVAPGVCIRLWGQHAPLEALTPPELQREELVEPMLAAACAEADLSTLGFVDPLPEKSLALAHTRLLDMAAIDAEGRVTEHGRRLFPLPIDTQFAHLITAMPDKACMEAMVDLAAALSLGQRLWRLPGSEAGRQALKEWQPLPCDALTLVTLLRKTPPEVLGIDPALLAEARQLSGQIRAALELPQLSASSHLPYRAWQEAILAAMPELAFVRRAKRRDALGNGLAEVQPGRESRFDEEAEAALVLDQHSLPGRGVKQTLNLATCMMPVTLPQLVAAAVGEEQQGDVRQEVSGMVVVMERVYAGRVIDRRETLPQGAAARQALAGQILAGELLAPVGERLTADTRAWALWLALGEAEGEPVVADSWLLEQLEALGVESEEDLALLEPEDLRFEGVPEWQRAEFDARFPHFLVLAELKLHVEYHPRAKRVTVVYAEGSRKGDPKRWELPAWAGWRVQYRKASRVIDVR